MRIISYNINGLRAALSRGFLDWLQAADPDVLCLQEVKAEPHQFDEAVFCELGYQCYWHPAVKKGYSGVAILTRPQPDRIKIGCGQDVYDREGRVIQADFSGVSIINTYMPSGSSSPERQAFKFRWLDDFRQYLKTLRQQHSHLVVCGDYNICHQSIDIHNPAASARCSGFLPEERTWFGELLADGYVDSFRHFNSEPHHYTWWSYRSGARRRNLGWRIDYQLVSENLLPRLQRAVILREAPFSDHCPVLIELNFDGAVS